MKQKRKTKAQREKLQQKRRRLELIQIAEYLVSGGLYFWVGYGAFFVLDSMLGWSLWWAKMTASVVGWTANYLLQRYWVFRNPALAKHQVEVTGRYAVITLVNFLLDYVIVYVLQLVGITPYIGQFVSAGFFTVWNYLWYKMWVFSTHIHRKRPVKNKRRHA
jgi:putative flippase GtrA